MVTLSFYTEKQTPNFVEVEGTSVKVFSKEGNLASVISVASINNSGEKKSVEESRQFV